MYGKTFFRLVSFFFTTLNNKFFSIYNYLFRFFVFLYSVFNEHLCKLCLLVGPSGLEPPTSCLSGTRSNLLSYEPMWLVKWFLFSLGNSLLEVSLVSFLFKESNWWRWWDSNPWPPACRAGALPAELHPHLIGFCFLLFSGSGNGFIRSLSCVGIELFSRAASSQVFSPLQSLTSVFGMGTGGPSAFVTPTYSVILHHWKLNNFTHKNRSSSYFKSFELTR